MMKKIVDNLATVILLFPHNSGSISAAIRNSLQKKKMPYYGKKIS